MLASIYIALLLYAFVTSVNHSDWSRISATPASQKVEHIYISYTPSP